MQGGETDQAVPLDQVEEVAPGLPHHDVGPWTRVRPELGGRRYPLWRHMPETTQTRETFWGLEFWDINLY